MGVRSEYRVGAVVGGESSVLVLPTDRSIIKSTTIPLILCAGRGATAWQMFADPYTGHFVRPIVEAGRPVLCLAPGGGASWGNATAMSRIDSGRTYLGNVLGIRTDLVAVGGFSMGGLASLNYARLNPSAVRACAVICPAVAVQSLHDSNGTYATEIEAAYGGGSWLTNSANYDPTRTTHPSGVPTKMWYSTNDTAAVTATQTAFLAANASITGVSLGAVGHSPLTVDTTFGDFIAANA